MPSLTHSLLVVCAAKDEESLSCGFPKEECGGVILTVGEGLAKVIRYSNRNRYDQEIEFDCLANEELTEFTLLNQGVPRIQTGIVAKPSIRPHCAVAGHI
jgi:anti-sigma regulatory factor (Ser/Thr protein kinase)